MLVKLGETSALAGIRDARLISALIDLAEKNENDNVRLSAFRALSNFQDERIIKMISSALYDPNRKIRLAAVHIMAELGEESHMPILAGAFQSETNNVVRNAIEQTMVRIKPKELSEPDSTVKVAAIQFMSEFSRPEVNREIDRIHSRQAAADGAKIVVLPETAVSGYMSYDIRTGWHASDRSLTAGVRGVAPDDVAEQVPGVSTDMFAALADELDIYLTVPIVEKDIESGKFFNTLCLVGPEGDLLLHYRKQNLWLYADQGWMSEGDLGLPYVDTEFGRIALLICFDINFELHDVEAQDVDILLYAVAWVDHEKSPWFSSCLPRMARDYDVSMVVANWTVPGKPRWHGYGHSCVISRSSSVLAKASQDHDEEIVYARLPVYGR